MELNEQEGARTGYRPPESFEQLTLAQILESTKRAGFERRQPGLLNDVTTNFEESLTLNIAGNVEILKQRCVSIIGARNATDAGRLRARRLARELVSHGVVVMSGLADGIDTAAMTSAIAAGGRTAGVIGTPLEIAYPAKNKRLQETIYRDHVLISQFKHGMSTFPSNFPKRNRLMALLSDATVVIEASDSSGTLHQANECLLLNRWLFIARSVVENGSISWPSRFLSSTRCQILDSTEQLISTVYGPL